MANENDLIRRGDLKEALASLTGMFTDELGFVIGLDAILRKVEFAEDVDAVEVKHGRWIEDGYNDCPCVCSHCGNEAHYTSTFKEQFDYDWEENLVSTGYEEIREYIRSDYCPNCGAKMDGGNEDV